MTNITTDEQLHNTILTLPSNRNGLPIAIFDIDGTLFDGRHRLHFLMSTTPDWESFRNPEIVMKDPPITQVCSMARRFHATHMIIIVSGRSYIDADITVHQLKSQGIMYDQIYLFCHILY